MLRHHGYAQCASILMDSRRRVKLKGSNNTNQESTTESSALPNRFDFSSAFSLPFRQPARRCHSEPLANTRTVEDVFHGQPPDLLSASVKNVQYNNWGENSIEEISQDQPSYWTSASAVTVQNHDWGINAFEEISQGQPSYWPSASAVNVENHGWGINAFEGISQVQYSCLPAVPILDTEGFLL